MLIGLVLLTPAVCILAALVGGLMEMRTALLMLFLMAGGQFAEGRGSWIVGLAGYYGIYGVLMVAQEYAIARRWLSTRSSALDSIGHFFSHFQIG